MARGKGNGKDQSGGNTLPRFVDVKLTPEQREDFKKHLLDADGCARFLKSITDDGYRVGVSWSGEHNSYTVSLTCRQKGDPNEGLCMTSFAGTLLTAVSLASYKHMTVTKGDWLEGWDGAGEDFG